MMKALQLIVALLILVTVHELGHYFFARMFGIKVNKFYLFFNPGLSLLKYNPLKGTLEICVNSHGKAWKTLKVGKEHKAMPNGKPTWRDTIYGLGWLPLGGYCAIAGMVDETQSKGDLAPEPQPWEFRTKAAWKRLLVMVAGVLMNFVLAIIIYAGLAFYYGEKVIPYENRTEGMNFSPEMLASGFENGDIIQKLNGRPIDLTDMGVNWDAVQEGAQFEVLRLDSVSGNRYPAKVTVNGNVLKALMEKGSDYRAMWTRFPVVVQSIPHGYAAEQAGILPGDRFLKIDNDTTPYADEFFRSIAKASGRTADFTVLRDGKESVIPVEVNAEGKIGVMLMPEDSLFESVTVHYNIFQAVPRGVEMGVGILTTYVKSLKALFTKDGVKNLGGFGAIGEQFPDKWNWPFFWYFTAFLSVILAFMNIIPIPALDGGYTLFLLWEMITRRKPSDRFLEVANTIGLVFLLLLLVVANGNDIYRMIFK